MQFWKNSACGSGSGPGSGVGAGAGLGAGFGATGFGVTFSGELNPCSWST